MSRYLLSLFSVMLAIVFASFASQKKDFADFYKFSYQLTTYAKVDEEIETVANWGYGTLVHSTTDFSLACSGTLAKACEIIVPSTSVVSDGIGLRLRSLDAGDPPSGNNVSIVTALNTFTSTYYVTGGTNVLNKKNKS